MKKFLTMTMVLALLAVLPVTALAQNGYYTWSLSASGASAFIHTAAVPAPGIYNLYLWYVQGCHPEAPGGMSAAEFKVVLPAGWSALAFTPDGAFLQVGMAAADGWNFLLAVASCPTGPALAGNLLLSVPGTGGRAGFTITDTAPGYSSTAATIDCGTNPTLNEFPAVMRCIGFATTDALPFQDHGQDCNVISVESASWGQIKGLYR